MDAHRFSLQRMALRAFDLSERSVRLGRRSQQQRVARWNKRLWMICQCAITAGLAWLIANRLLGHPAPVFGPVAAVVTLGFSFGQRIGRAMEVAVGVAVGVFFGDLFVKYFGTGVWQIIFVCFLAMSVATWLGARTLMVIQAGLQSIIVLTLLPAPNEGLNRWLDALVGCVLALAMTTIAPASSLRRPRLLAAGVLTEAAGTLTEIRRCLSERDLDAGEVILRQARSTEDLVADLDEATTEGLAVVRYSPFLRSNLPALQEISQLTGPLDRMLRNLRVLARRSAVVLWREEHIPSSYLDLLDRLALETRWCAGELYERRMPVAARPRLIDLGRASSQVELIAELSPMVMLAQMRSIMVDLLELTGMAYADARESMPDMD